MPSFIHAKSIYSIPPCTSCIIHYYNKFINIEGVYLITCSPSTFISIHARKLGLDLIQKALESTLIYVV